MGWAALSLRKMTLKQRINSLEQRLVNISQQEMSMYDSSSYAQQAIGVQKTQALSHFQQIFEDNSNAIKQQYAGATSTQDLNSYNTAIQTEQLSLQYSQMIQNSLFQAKESAMQNSINQSETQIALEKEQVETQLEAARAEYESLDQACSSDIKSGAINFGV